MVWLSCSDIVAYLPSCFLSARCLLLAARAQVTTGDPGPNEQAVVGANTYTYPVSPIVTKVTGCGMQSPTSEHSAPSSLSSLISRPAASVSAPLQTRTRR